MRIHSLFEAADDDIRRSMHADKFIQRLVTYLHAQVKAGREVGNLRKYVVSHDHPDGFPGVVSDNFGYEFGMFRGILVCFRHDDYPGTNGSASPVEDPSSPVRYVIQMDVNAKDMQSLMFSVSSTRGTTILRHELAHVTDYIRYRDKAGIPARKIVTLKKTVAAMSREEQQAHSDKVADTYHNDPLERNAFYHNIAEPILQHLRYMQTDSMALEFLDPLPRDFRQYLDSTLRKQHGVLRQHWDHLSPDGKRRIISRLNNLFVSYWEQTDARAAQSS